MSEFSLHPGMKFSRTQLNRQPVFKRNADPQHGLPTGLGPQQVDRTFVVQSSKRRPLHREVKGARNPEGGITAQSSRKKSPRLTKPNSSPTLSACSSNKVLTRRSCRRWLNTPKKQVSHK